MSRRTWVGQPAGPQDARAAGASLPPRPEPASSPTHTWVPARPPGSPPDVSLAVLFKAPPAPQSEYPSSCRQFRVQHRFPPTPARRALPVRSGPARTAPEGESDCLGLSWPRAACSREGWALLPRGKVLRPGRWLMPQMGCGPGRTLLWL